MLQAPQTHTSPAPCHTLTSAGPADQVSLKSSLPKQTSLTAQSSIVPAYGCTTFTVASLATALPHCRISKVLICLIAAPQKSHCTDRTPFKEAGNKNGSRGKNNGSAYEGGKDEEGNLGACDVFVAPDGEVTQASLPSPCPSPCQKTLCSVTAAANLAAPSPTLQCAPHSMAILMRLWEITLLHYCLRITYQICLFSPDICCL